MDTENTTDEQNPSISKGTKQRMKERSRSQTTPTNTDINDPENLDYEDIDDNHSPGKLDDSHELEQINKPVKKINEEIKTSINIQDEEDKILHKPQEIINNNNTSLTMIDNPTTASDEGEVDEADLEDGEIHDPSTSKNRTSFSDDQTSEQNRNRINTNILSSPQAKVHCRFFLQGRCHWGPNCKFIHPNNDATKNSSGPSIDVLSSTNNEITSPTLTGIPIPQTTPTTNTWISPQATSATSQFFPNPVLRGPTQPSVIPLVVPPTGTESAWERGLRSAKTLREQSMRRKQQDKDFNDKKFNLTIRDALDDKDGDDNILNIDRPSPMDYDLNNLSGSNYPDRYHSYMYTGSSGNSHYNNNNNHHHRNNNNNNTNNNNIRNNTNILSTNDHSDRRLRHSDDHADTRNDNRNRKENLSTKHNKLTSKKDDSSSSYRRNSSQQQYISGSHHNNDAQAHFNPYSSRRGDDWQDPWDRSRTHGGGNRRSSGGGREPSYSSSSATSSSSSRSTHSRSHSTSSSSRSRQV
ncbi:unnamed protein product [Rotaria sp. Silwood1]|nr:unnamed protein product [Rotaria sp. Silwood1]